MLGFAIVILDDLFLFFGRAAAACKGIDGLPWHFIELGMEHLGKALCRVRNIEKSYKGFVDCHRWRSAKR